VGAYVGWSQGSHRNCPLAIERTSSSTFTPAAAAVSVVMDVPDIVLNAPRK
jgi:hypothetical protein